MGEHEPVIRSVQTVEAPDGRTWVVRRRWVPRLGAESLWGRIHRRFRQSFRHLPDVGDGNGGCLAMLGEGLAVAVSGLAIVTLLLFVAVPLLVAVVDVVVVVVVLVLGGLARVLFRRPWVVEARANDGTTSSWRVVGWTASGERCTEIAQLLAAGVPLPGG